MVSDVLPISTGKPVTDARYANNSKIYIGAALEAFRNKFAVHDSNKITNWSLFGGTWAGEAIEKHCSDEFKSVFKSMDKSFIASKSTQDAIGNMFDCKFHTNDAGEIIMSATKDNLKTRTGKLAANALGVTTKFGVLTSCIAEAPDLYAAYKNGDFGKQTARSGANVATSTVAFGIASHLAKEYLPTRLKPIFMIAGVAASLASSHYTNKITDQVLGKSIKQQNRDAQAV